MTALRRGETDNCVMCRGESSCILPIAPAAVHTNPTGSRLAIRHFTEYLEQFPDDLDVRWLLNLAHMTLGEHPDKVDPRFLISLDQYLKSEFDIGKFRDIGHAAGVNRFNMAGGAVMEDFDNDGLLDLAVTAFDPDRADGFLPQRRRRHIRGPHQAGRAHGAARAANTWSRPITTTTAGWISSSRAAPGFIFRSGSPCCGTTATAPSPTSPRQAGLLGPVNSTSSRWADYDNDGWLDVFIVCETQTNRLYHNRGNGTFEDVTARAGRAARPRALLQGCQLDRLR